MKTQTIQQIEEQVNQAEQALGNFDLRQHKEETYGPEQEYTPQSLKGGITAVLVDIRGLVKAHNIFVQSSTYSERNNIYSYLSNIAASLNNKDYNDTTNYLEELKPIIHNYNVRGSSETQEILEERVNQLTTQCLIAEENINTTERIREKAEHAEQRLQTTEEKIVSLDGILEKLQNKSEQIEILQEKSQQNHQTIEESLTSAKSHTEIINSFVQRVEQRERQLDRQGHSTMSYQEQLTSFEQEHGEKLENAETLIKEARNALEYTTAAGISAAFNERYNEEKAKSKISLWWLVGATIFMGAGIGIGIWLVLDNQAIGLGLTMSRIAIMSVTFSGVWFCATQYVRHKNTLDDYGYKSVLAKSMIAFLDQFQQTEEREYYLQTILREIHQDPLRKKHDVDTPASKILGMLRSRRTDNQSDV